MLTRSAALFCVSRGKMKFDVALLRLHFIFPLLPCLLRCFRHLAKAPRPTPTKTIGEDWSRKSELVRIGWKSTQVVGVCCEREFEE